MVPTIPNHLGDHTLTLGGRSWSGRRAMHPGWSSQALLPLYHDYGLLFALLKDERWLLTPHAASVDDREPWINAFVVSQGVLILVVRGSPNGSGGTRARVTAANLPELCSLLPGRGQAEEVSPGFYEVELERGMAALLLE